MLKIDKKVDKLNATYMINALKAETRDLKLNRD